MIEDFAAELRDLAHQYPDFAPYMVFFCILGSSLTFVISLDLLIFTGAMIGVYFDSFTPFLIACYLGTFSCGQVDYWIGRILGQKLLQYKKISGLLPQERLDKVQNFLHKYGPLTFIIGRFIPFGFRLAMFIGAGIFKFRYATLVLTDLVASFIWTSCVFTIFYHFGQNTGWIKEKFIFLLPLAMIFILIYIHIQLRRKCNAVPTDNHILNEDPISSRLPEDEH